MATATVCDMDHSGGDPAAAAWMVRLRTLKDNTLSTYDSLDACADCVGDAFDQMVEASNGLEDFHSVEATRL